MTEAVGAEIYEPFIREELGRLHNDESQLQEALRLYREAGATGHAHRLERELDEAIRATSAPPAHGTGRDDYREGP